MFHPIEVNYPGGIDCGDITKTLPLPGIINSKTGWFQRSPKNQGNLLPALLTVCSSLISKFFVSNMGSNQIVYAGIGPEAEFDGS